MEIREIELNGKKYQYELNIKAIKRCYLKVVSGKIVVSCSPLFTISEIERLIKQNQDKIIHQVGNYVVKANYRNGGHVNIFNRTYQIKLIDLKHVQASIHDNEIYVYHHKVQLTIEKKLKELLESYISWRIEYYLKNSFNNLTRPQIVIKKMKSRWGACYPTQNKVCFNLVLVHLDKSLIDYVIVHELCHFYQANHSALFYQEIAMRMADYKQREKKLREQGI